LGHPVANSQPSGNSQNGYGNEHTQANPLEILEAGLPLNHVFHRSFDRLPVQPDRGERFLPLPRGCVLIFEDGASVNNVRKDAIEHLPHLHKVPLRLQRTAPPPEDPREGAPVPFPWLLITVPGLAPLGGRRESPMGVTAKLMDAVVVKNKLRLIAVHHTVNASVAGEGTTTPRLFLPVVLPDALMFVLELLSC
jgi:hypothetical protein